MSCRISYKRNKTKGIDPAQGGSFRWLSEELSHLQATHSSVLRLVERRGPFDGVMGFSEGGAVAAALLVLDARQRFAHFKCGIFFCAAAPMDPETVLQGDTGFMDAARDGVVIHVPTAHIWASNDEKHELMGKDLVGLCNAALREEYVHEMGHSVPSGDAFPQMLRAVERTIERAKSLG